MNPKPDEIVGVIEDGIFREAEPADYGFETLPNYTTDLNAMHEAEKTLTPIQATTYFVMLDELLEDRVVFATAAQRAEAFLRTIGKWEDS